MAKPFLTARWESLLLLNYACPPQLLEPLVPRGTELDSWDGATLVSLVGFSFLDTRVAGLRVPGHHSFVEVNLRFYVRRKASRELRRGVVFIRELVPRPLVAALARLMYNEPYLSVPMSRNVQLDPASGGTLTYSWSHRDGRHSIDGRVDGPPQLPGRGSEAEFITEHYWGYNRQRNGDTLEYRVEHPQWLVWQCIEARYTSPQDVSLYGSDLTAVLTSQPVSAFVAKGSDVRVHRGTRVGAV